MVRFLANESVRAGQSPTLALRKVSWKSGEELSFAEEFCEQHGTFFRFSSFEIFFFSWKDGVQWNSELI